MGPPGDLAVHRGLKGLGQNGLGVDGGHAEKGRHPHPEDGPRPAGCQRGGAAGDVAGAHLRRHRGGQRLKAAHAVLAGRLAVQAEPAEQVFDAGAELAHLHKAQPDGEKDAGAAQQKQQKIVPQKVADGADRLGKCLHIVPLTFRKMPPVKAECSKLCAIQIQMPAHRTLGASIPCFCGKVKCARRAAAAQKMPRRRAGWGRAARFGRAARKGGERTPGARRAGKSAGGKKVRRGPKGRKWGWDYKTRPAGRRCAARRYCPPGCR